MSMPQLERFYRLGLLLFPRSFRAELAPPMIADFRALLAAEPTRSGRIRATVRELIDLVRGAASFRLGFGGGGGFGSHRSGRGWGGSGWESELRAALRGLARKPGAVLAAALSLTLAIGAVTAVFSVVHGVVLKPLPYRAPQQLGFVWDGIDWIGLPRAWVAPAEVLDLRRQSQLFEGFAAIDTDSYQSADQGQAIQVAGGAASANLFELLGVSAALGRTFVSGEDEPGAQPVVVLTWGFWRERYGGDESAVGRTLRLDGVEHTIVGVLPREVDFLVHSSVGRPQPARLWTTLRADLQEEGRDNHGLAVLARVRPGVTIEQARAELTAIGENVDREHYGDRGFTFRFTPIHRDLIADSRASLWLLLGAAGFLLLLAASNTATLLLARAQARRRDFEVRLALGAQGWRLFAVTLFESFALCLTALGVGLIAARAGLASIKMLVGDRVPRMRDVGLDPTVVAVAASIAVLVALACALLPMLELRRRVRTRQWQARGAVGTRSVARRALVVVQMASALVLGAGSVLLVRSVWNLERADYGFRPDGVVTARLVLPEARYPEASDLAGFSSRLLDGVRSIPGVRNAGLGSSLPLAADTSQTMAIRGDVDPERPSESLEASEATFVDFVSVTPGYLEALDVELLEGRSVSAADSGRELDELVAVIDDRLAETFFGGVENAVGRTVRLGGVDRSIVGVARHARFYEARGDDRPQVFLAYPDGHFRGLALVVDADRDVEGTMEEIRGVVRSIDPAQPIYDVRTYADRMDAALAGDRLLAVLVTGFGIVAFVLAAVGVLGLLGVLVGQRRAEVGLRVALGAGRGEVARMVLKQTTSIVLPGIVVGLAVALALRGVLSSALFGVGASDPAALIGAAAGLLVLALVASCPPLLRALRVDPASTLREQG